MSHIIPLIQSLFDQPMHQIKEQIKHDGLALSINQINWVEYSHAPEVSLFLAHTDKELCLLYCVDKDFVQLVYHEDQEPVWQDSCVEFFVAYNGGYRNFEFNALGVCLAGFGEGRHDRIRLDVIQMSSIQRYASILSAEQVSSESPTGWNLLVTLPLDLILEEGKQSFRANFYKCGDHTPKPHYLSWQPISTASPDFHRPEYFGELILQ